jgi:hypothetical protein
VKWIAFTQDQKSELPISCDWLDLLDRCPMELRLVGGMMTGVNNDPSPVSSTLLVREESVAKAISLSTSPSSLLCLPAKTTESAFAMAMATITATWRKVTSADTLQRSSQAMSVVDDKAYIFGGELQPREPRDNHVIVTELSKGIRHYALVRLDVMCFESVLTLRTQILLMEN